MTRLLPEFADVPVHGILDGEIVAFRREAALTARVSAPAARRQEHRLDLSDLRRARARRRADDDAQLQRAPSPDRPTLARRRPWSSPAPSRCTGALPVCAFSTRRDICASAVVGAEF